jgi:hypothetical protein
MYKIRVDLFVVKKYHGHYSFESRGLFEHTTLNPVSTGFSASCNSSSARLAEFFSATVNYTVWHHFNSDFGGVLLA